MQHELLQPGALRQLGALVLPSNPARDLEACRAVMSAGSRTFTVASRLLPARVRQGAMVLYAFCRVADDAVDLSSGGQAEIDALRNRLDRLFWGMPANDPIDRSLGALVRQHALPRLPFDALLEGLSWDAAGRTYETLDDLMGYAARVASSVGVLMSAMMGGRDREILARACELGAAMQLTNIARDVAEDARRGRVYLPQAWLDAAGVPRGALFPEVRPHPGLCTVVENLLHAAASLYRRAEPGIAGLPPDCRPGIRAARWIYADIGRVIARRGFAPWKGRARVGALRKIVLILRALASTPTRTTAAPVLPQFRSLVEATAITSRGAA